MRGEAGRGGEREEGGGRREKKAGLRFGLVFGERLEGDRLASGSSSMICGQGLPEGPSYCRGWSTATAMSPYSHSGWVRGEKESVVGGCFFGMRTTGTVLS